MTDHQKKAQLNGVLQSFSSEDLVSELSRRKRLEEKLVEQKTNEFLRLFSSWYSTYSGKNFKAYTITPRPKEVVYLDIEGDQNCHEISILGRFE